MKLLPVKMLLSRALVAAPLLMLCGCSDNKSEIPTSFVDKPDGPPSPAGGPPAAGKGKDKVGGGATSQ